MNKIYCDYPLIETFSNFLTHDECREIINFSESRLVPGRVIGKNGEEIIDYAHRSALTTFIRPDEDVKFRDNIIEKVSKLIGIEKSRFERMTIIKYTKGDEFKVHQDYFINRSEKHYIDSNSVRCKFGGNRVGTVIIYLNTVETGGETHFPWVNVTVKPEEGSLCYFKYDYDDWQANIRSQHAGMKISEGEKWIVTLWIREQSLEKEVTNYKQFIEESEVYSRVCNVEYELECGPDYDKKTLNISLPGNTDPLNTIIVGFTGGMDSSLLLYLVGMLNNMQEIPYIVQPVCVTSKECIDEHKIAEEWPNVDLMSNLIRDKIDGNIRKLLYISAPSLSDRKNQVREGLLRYFNKDDDYSIHRFRKHQYIFVGDNAVPNDDFFVNLSLPNRYKKVAPLPWFNPFISLQKYHVVDVLIQLELEDVFKYTSKCIINHSHLLDKCVSFQCNERRWAFSKLNKETIGDLHFVNKGK